MEKKLGKWSGITWRKKGEEGGEIERVRQYRREIKRLKRINWDRGIKRKSGGEINRVRWIWGWQKQREKI
jgi:hypothetical protein